MITSAEEFIALRNSSDRTLYMRAAHDNAPEEVWLEVITKYPEMRKWVAHNKTVSPNILRILAQDEDSQVRSTVARKRKLDPALFKKLALDHSESVRLAVVLNKKTPLSVLRKLIDDDWARIAEVAYERVSQKTSSRKADRLLELVQTAHVRFARR